jgi:brefeldin A-inhibited guanine nucleotide-exchange protein
MLSMHLISVILSSNPHVFYLPAPVLFAPGFKTSDDVLFVFSVKRFMCLVFTRNIVSIVPQIFDFSMEIFSLMVCNFRKLLKVIFIYNRTKFGFYLQKLLFPCFKKKPLLHLLND